MKSRHAAALALVGWYLMIPPMGLHVEVEYNAPLSQWDMMGSFDSADECEKAYQQYNEAGDQRQRGRARIRVLFTLASRHAMHRQRRPAPQGKISDEVTPRRATAAR